MAKNLSLQFRGDLYQINSNSITGSSAGGSSNFFSSSSQQMTSPESGPTVTVTPDASDMPEGGCGGGGLKMATVVKKTTSTSDVVRVESSCFNIEQNSYECVDFQIGVVPPTANLTVSRSPRKKIPTMLGFAILVSGTTRGKLCLNI